MTSEHGIRERCDACKGEGSTPTGRYDWCERGRFELRDGCEECEATGYVVVDADAEVAA